MDVSKARPSVQQHPHNRHRPSPRCEPKRRSSQLVLSLDVCLRVEQKAHACLRPLDDGAVQGVQRCVVRGFDVPRLCPLFSRTPKRPVVSVKPVTLPLVPFSSGRATSPWIVTKIPVPISRGVHSSSSFATSRWPLTVATCGGVKILGARALADAPASRSVLATSLTGRPCITRLEGATPRGPWPQAL
eukprot:CAMPEP_0180249346 /NCGR_PEP_ID=MMETSP0987-20121128/37254_1 /TAXON_ID=697907 /ORGANISM="non described non described, Strain CCMP2293" /LENGTH=187 /DNA_ID=CAMNT_0022217613 /DNA_START=38 /DNA_END=601 /DNA_ORIENTATION=+